MATRKKKVSQTKRNLDPRKLGVKIQDMHELVKARMEQKEWSTYRLAKEVSEVGSKITEQTIRNFVVGGKSMRSNHLEVVFAVLGLEVRPKR